MLAKITAYNGTIYRFATSTQDTADGIYTGRIVEEIDFTSQSSDNGAAPNTINITIRNDDDFIPKNVDLWGATIDLTATNGKSWRGKITFFSFDADGNVYITATEKSLPELELQMPDEVRQVYTIDDNFHQSSQTMTIPLVVGGTHSSPISLPTILIDKQNGIYLICTGEIREIVKVYNGSEELPSTAYTAYTGTAAQAEHKGFAYVKINSDYRTNADGSYAEINVDVVGLKLGNHTEAECRNGARFLYYFLTTPATGVNGWGLGIDPSEIDTASFNTAITLCDASNFKLDGIMWLRQSADAWINQICQAIHGNYSININGKRTLTIDYAGAASKATFGANDMRISRYGKNAYTGAIYNKGVLSYGYNPITGLFMQSAQYENSESVAQIGEQKFVGESYLINDAATALAVLEYTCKKSQIAAESIEFETDRLDTLLYAGDLITISRSDISISGTFQIKSISTSESKSIISASRFDSSVFVVGGSHTNINWGNEKAITPALTPAEATNLLLTTGFDINPDGTGTPYIKGTFTPPAGGWIAAAVQYGIGTNPANWTELALITNGQFVIQPVSVGTVYTVRIRMITATGHSDYISGQIISTGDSIAPAIPTIAVNATDKSVIVQCAIDNPPYDMGGFQIHRKKHSESVYTLIGNVAANRGYASFSDYVDEWVAYDYKAKSYDRSGNLSDFSEVKTVTVTGIQANDVAATALKIPTGSILRLSAKGCTTASIKQTTDASGNPVYGVKDVSGYNHHGQAFGNVTVLDGGEGFAFDGSSGYARIDSIGSRSNDSGYTVSLYANFASVATGQWLINRRSTNGNSVLDWQLIWYSGSMNWNVWDSDGSSVIPSDQKLKYDNPVADEWHQYTLTVDFETRKGVAYKDGLKVAECIFTNTPNNTECSITLGRAAWQTSYYFNGSLRDVRIYPRALSATEVKSMYMLPDEAIFGQLNADLIGANVIRASNLVMTEALITNAAQIDQAVVNNLNVSGNATFQSGLTNTLNSAKSDATTKANAVQTNLNTVTNNIYAPNTTKINGGNIYTGSVDAYRIGADSIKAGAITAQKLSVTALQPLPPSTIRLLFNGLTTNSIKSSVPDLSGKGYQFKGYGSGLTVSHRNDGCDYVTLNGSNDYLGATVSGNDFDPSNSMILIDFMLKTAPSQIAYLVCLGNGSGFSGTRLGLAFTASDRKLYMIQNGVYNELDTGYVVPLNTRVRILATFGANKRLMVNGVEVFSKGMTAASAVAANTLCIGARCGSTVTSATYFVNINLYEFRMWGDTNVGGLSNTADMVMADYKLGTDTESGQITADRIATSALRSRNYSGNANTDAGLAFTSQGSFFNLDKGTLATPFFRIGCNSNNVYNCQIGCFKINSDNSLIGEDFTSPDNPAITMKAPIAGGNFTTVLSAGGLSIRGSYSIRPYQLKGRSSLSEKGLVFYDSDDPTTYSNIIHGINVIVPGVIQDTLWGLYTTGDAYCASGTWSGSDRNTKSHIKSESVLNRLKQISISSWKYDQDKIDSIKAEKKGKEYKRKNIGTKDQPKHFGAMAEEFNSMFGTSDGSSDSLCYTDTIGVCMRAIQELSEQLDNAVREIRRLKRILRANGTITDEIIAEDRDNEAIRRLEIAQARQAKREARLLANENAVIEPIAEDEPTEPQLDDEPTD